jgi:uncharacterized protein YihD (DUF1040 family)
MRDPNRIYEIISLIQAGWQKVPDMRFGQIIENLKRYIGVDDLFYIEDDRLKEMIIDYFDLEDK